MGWQSPVSIAIGSVSFLALWKLATLSQRRIAASEQSGGVTCSSAHRTVSENDFLCSQLSHRSMSMTEPLFFDPIAAALAEKPFRPPTVAGFSALPIA
jgi:hypothetical protein